MSGDIMKENEEELEALTAEEILKLQAEEALTPEPEADQVRELLSQVDETISEGTELGTYESAEIEEVEFIETSHLMGILESVLFASDRPLSFAMIKQVFQGTNIKNEMLRRALHELQTMYASPSRGVTLEEVSGGYQLRTKSDHSSYLKRMIKARPFKLSGPALEVLSIVAYKQPVVKNEVDQIRGVESGHLMRALMDRALIKFEGRSELPGKPMYYGTTRRFLEIFGLRNLKELPSLSEIDQLLPEGISEDQAEGKKESLSDVTAQLGIEAGKSYSDSEEELLSIASQLTQIDTSTEFFEQEKIRERERRDKERAETIREAVAFNETVEPKDLKWLERYEKALEEKMMEASEFAPAEMEESSVATDGLTDGAAGAGLAAFESEEDKLSFEEMEAMRAIAAFESDGSDNGKSN